MKMAWLKSFCKIVQTKPASVVKNQSGQAIIEYMLILVISVSIILGTLYQFSDAFRRTTASYFGDYLSCLLETGELPSTDGGGECGRTFEPFSLANGRPLIPPGGGSGVPGGGSGAGPGGGNGGGIGRDGAGGGGGSGGGVGTGRDGSQAGRGGRSEATDPAITDSGASGGSGGGGVGSVRGGNSLTLKLGEDKKGSNISTAGADATGSENDREERSGRGYANASSSATATATSSYDIFLGRLRYIPSAAEERPISESGTTVEISEAGKKQAQRRVAGSVDSRSSDEDPELDGSLTLPNFIRYILIAAIIIILIFFIGMQLMAIQKGSQKGSA